MKEPLTVFFAVIGLASICVGAFIINEGLGFIVSGIILILTVIK